MSNQPEGTEQQADARSGGAKSEPRTVILNTKEDSEEARTASDEAARAAQRIEVSQPPPGRLTRLWGWTKRKSSEASLTDWAMAFFTFVLAATTIVFTVYAKRQWQEMKSGGDDTKKLAENAGKQVDQLKGLTKATQDSVSAIERQMRQDQRPWIRFDIADPKTTPAVSWDIKVGGPLTAPSRFTNVGKTPAINVEIVALVDIIAKGADPPLPPHGWRNPQKRDNLVGAAIIHSGTIFPASGVGQTITRFEIRNGAIVKKVLSVPEANEIAQGRAYLAIFGIARYSDVFGYPHWTRFCKGSFANGEEANSTSCANFNAVDADGNNGPDPN